MEKVISFAERIHNRLEQHRHDLADKQPQIKVIPYPLPVNFFQPLPASSTRPLIVRV
jgi:hypothetical protein